MNLRQLLRERHLWYINLFIIVVSEVAPAFAELFTFGKVDVAIIECASACVYLGVLLFVITSCFHLLGKELNEKVALTMFSKPIHMRTFIMAKFFSILAAVTVIFLFQSIWVWKQFYIYDIDSSSLKTAFIWLLCVYLQGVILLAMSMGLTVLAGPIIGILCTFILMTLPYVWSLTSLVWVSWILPAFPWFDISNALYKGVDVPFSYALLLIGYAIFYSSSWLFVSVKAIEAKEF